MTAVEALPLKIQKKIQLGERCWTWTGGKSDRGYGHVWYEGRTWLVHRLAYMLLVGPIPDGLTIDHLCFNKLCVNPSHLEPVTNAENLRRRRPVELQTHCVYGHEFAGYNLLLRPSGRRACRTCDQRRKREFRARRRLKTDAGGMR